MTTIDMPQSNDTETASSRLLAAGPLTVELEGGNLRAIRWHGHEAIRAISYLVRDQNWGNYGLELSNLSIQETKADFSVRYRATCRAGDGASLRIDVHIAGSAGGRLSFEAEAVPDADMPTNRCGFCVLHPVVGVAGRPVTVEHTDGTEETSRFPDIIEPAQPFFDIRALTHEISPGMTAQCRMDGDTFEMEDQRNWTDASYKTYVRPLALPWPYTLQANVPNRQTVTVILIGKPAAPAMQAGDMVRLSIGDPHGAIPDFGLGIRPGDLPETLDNIHHLHDIAPQHLVLTFDPLSGDDLQSLKGYAALLDAYPVRATLECVLPCKASPAEELASIAEMVGQAGLTLSAIAVSPAPDLKSTPPGSVWPECPPLADIYAAARSAFPGLPLGGGMFSYFTELNRKRPPVHLLDFVTHTTSPLVHAADDRSVMETLEALPFITRSVRAFAGDMPYCIGPSSIGMRGNPYGAALNENPKRQRMTMVADDPRQPTRFAAAWMIGYAAATADAGLDLLALGSLTGPFGIVENGRPTPAFEAARWLGRIAGQAARAVTSSDPTRVLAIGGGETVIVANITPGPLRVALPGLRSVEIDGHIAETASAFELGAYGIALCTLEGRR